MGASQPEVTGGGRSGFAAPTGDDALRLQQLAKVTTELGAVETMDGIVEAAVNHAGEAIRAAVTTLMVRDGDQLVMIGGYGLQPGIAESWHSFPVDGDNPASDAVREGRPVSMASSTSIEKRYPSLTGQVPAGRSVVCLPLGAGAAPAGVLGVTFEDGWLPGPAELAFLTTFAEACGQAIRRVRSSIEAAERTKQLAFLAQASAELGSSLDYRSTLTKVASLVVPDLADWCAVDVVEAGELTTLAVAHVDPAKVEWAWEMQRRYPPDRDAATGASNVTRTGVSELYEEITDEMLVAGAQDEEHLRLSRGLHLRSAMVVPLAAHGRTLGAITLLRADSDRAYTKSDLAVAEDLGRRAGIAIDNALLHSQTRDVALQLQRAVLPEGLERIEGWEVAAYYEPGGRAEVGGDFYDAIPLPDGRHGVSAAAAMAQLRASVRAFVSVDPAPSLVIAKLERMFALFGIVKLVSLVYGLVDPAREELVLVNAGHYPPAIVRASRTVEFAESVPRRPLGADPDKCGVTVFPFAAGDTLFLFTDGLIERRSEVIDVGMDRLRDHAGVLGRPALSAALHELVRTMHGGDGDDDVTALALRQRI
jgi:GAF domain-containing protein